MSVFTQFGDTLIKYHGDDKEVDEVDVASIWGKGKVVGVLFSGRWCPPCRIFIPKLCAWYEAFKKTENGDKFEIVFVSSDKDEKTFQEHFAEMPWLSLPYNKRAEKTGLSMHFKVSGIPTLVLINGETGDLITHDGRTVVIEDKDGSDFPWIKKTFDDIIPGNFINNRNQTIQWEDIKEDVIGLYFSANWCGPCRAYTPQLAKTYNKVREDKKSFQIIFVTSDRDEDSMRSYFSGMPWLAIPFGSSRIKSLSRHFNISGIPALVILKREGEVINLQGRNVTAIDPEGIEFPWNPKPVNALTGATAGEVNDSPSLIWFTDNNPDVIKEILTPVAEKHIQDVKSSVTDQKVMFFHHNDDDDEDDVGKSLKQFANLKENVSLLVLLDIPNQTVFVSKEPKVTTEVVRRIVDDFTEGNLAMTSFRS